ncbi:MAG: recombination mediator RecR [Dissulfuribacterales bacterium]
MNHYPAPIIRVIHNLGKLPGIGAKTAERLAMHLLNAPEPDGLELSASIGDLKKSVRLCSQCFALSDGDLCKICASPSRDKALLCVVENQADMVAIEKSGAYTGLYHLLGGLLSPMDNIGPNDIRIRELISKVEEKTIKEVIIATGTSVEGESTASYISDRLSGCPLSITRIASGVPMGGDLKYVDQVTLKKAMEARHAL